MLFGKRNPHNSLKRLKSNHDHYLLMCYSVSLVKDKEEIENRFNAEFLVEGEYPPVYHTSAFDIPEHPVMTNEFPGAIQMFSWGLVPFWVKDENMMLGMRTKTANARAETVFEKPSFRSSINHKRCMVLVDGFFEWMDVDGMKIPHHIKRKDGEAFALGGLWATWTNTQNEHILNSFSIITTQANPLLERIHNTKKRMPLILDKEKEREWLDVALNKREISNMLVPYPHVDLLADPVSQLISHRGSNTNIPEAIEPHNYDELKSIQKKLF